MSMALCGVGAAHAGPPGGAPEDPRVDTIARVHGYFVMSMFTSSLFERVEGVHADLCRLDFRDDAGELTQQHWVRFSPKRWEWAYTLSWGTEASRWIHYVADLDEVGRVARTTHYSINPGNHQRQKGMSYANDWDPDEGLAVAYTSGSRVAYIEDPDHPGYVRNTSFRHGLPYRMKITPTLLEMWEPGLTMRRHAFSWGPDDVFSVWHDTGQSTSTARYDARGVLLGRDEVRAPGRKNVVEHDIDVHFDANGRLERADAVSSGGKYSIHPVYGCAWPEVLGGGE